MGMKAKIITGIVVTTILILSVGFANELARFAQDANPYCSESEDKSEEKDRS